MWDPAVVGTGGIAGVLVVVIIYLMRQNHLDRRQYQLHIAEVEKSTAAAIARSEAQATELLEQLERERRARWAAEDDAARYRRLVDATQPGGGTT